MTILIIGAGITGLATAYLLAKAGLKVIIVEKEPQPGGLLNTFDVGHNHRLECFYHHFFSHDVELKWLLQELDLADCIILRKTTMGMFRNNQLYPFNGPGDILRFDAISLQGRLLFGLSSAMLIYFKKYSEREEVNSLDWFQRRAGCEATSAIWQPLLKIKFGEAANRIPLAWMASRLRQRLLSRQTGKELLGYIDGSFQLLVDRLIAILKDYNVDFYFGICAEKILFEKNTIVGIATSKGEIRADRVISTIPTKILGELMKPVAPDYAKELDSIEYMAAICTVLSLKKPLSSIYWTNVADPNYDFGGIIEQTNFIPPEMYNGQHLVYLSRYLMTDDALWRMDNESLFERQLSQLERMFKRDIRSLITKHWLFRTRFAAPLTDLGFNHRIPRYESPVPGLYVASMCHIYPEERSVNNSIRVATELIRAMGMRKAVESVPNGISLAAKYGK